MILCITNKCNRNCDFCFEGSFKKDPEQRMSVADVHRICEFTKLSQARSPCVTVMGGEPTLHPQMIQIVDLIQEINPRADVRLLTNLLCEPDLLRDLAARRTGGLVNVGGFAGYSQKEQELVRSNLALLRQNRFFRQTFLAVTIVEENQDFGFLYDILEQDQPRSISGIRVGISAPGTDFANRFPHEFSLGYGEKYLEVVERCHRIDPLLAFTNECFVNMCMMSERIHARMERVVGGFTKSCQGNLDLLPDFSTHWCFAFQGVPEMRIRNIFDYKDITDVYHTLCRKAIQLEQSLGRQCDTTNCRSIECPGPCIAIKYFRKHMRR